MLKFKEGDMIICVKHISIITFGKIYKVLYIDDDVNFLGDRTKVWIINDENIKDWYFDKCFVEIKEYRKKKLKSLKLKIDELENVKL